MPNINWDMACTIAAGILIAKLVLVLIGLVKR